ncbi:DegT/DnrJ/EryC1/StrS family aminotransferase [Polyangium sp. 15x6]|uniref:DegT/DnrJ/EryC1/StrS family aminotransferase n=1 Tax=Polyangium sp. 15x6 TaxID=3042687 RepID=UPI00249A2C38|nr:DegT/DnrJ/EryC1/StrS family aminotransferase [Polyangium sp. 15x6]MDI3282374.1 DegT/DnrJ/EryC1/StrS family aminotransferase [Polyangium sp. 15x6]
MNSSDAWGLRSDEPSYAPKPPTRDITVPLLDLRALHRAIREEIDRAIARVVEAQAFVLGEEVRLFEEAIAARLGAAHAIGVASGSDALLLSLVASGVGPGDEVVTTPFTFFATAGAIARLGARPVFVDIEPDSWNLDPARVLAALGPRTRAIVPVHLYGRVARMEAWLDEARARGIAIVEDAAQAIDARRGGRAAGTIGTLGCLSFFPSKNLGAFGDGGLVLTNDPEKALRVRRLRTHGGEKMYRHDEVGMNSRLDAIQAAVLRAKLPYLDGWTEARRAIADRYRALFAEAGLSAFVRSAEDDPEGRHVYHQFTIRAVRRDELRVFLESAGIGTAVYYPVPLHLQPCFAHLGHHTGDFPEAERACREVLSLPISPTLTPEQQQFVVDRIRTFYF